MKKLSDTMAIALRRSHRYRWTDVPLHINPRTLRALRRRKLVSIQIAASRIRFRMTALAYRNLDKLM